MVTKAESNTKGTCIHIFHSEGLDQECKTCEISDLKCILLSFSRLSMRSEDEETSKETSLEEFVGML